MKIQIAVSVFLIAFAGCQGEPTTPREEAEQAQENLEDARVRAAEMLAESEEDAVEIIADAKEDAQEEIQDGKREAAEIISDAKQELTETLDKLSDPPIVEPKPAENPDVNSP